MENVSERLDEIYENMGNKPADEILQEIKTLEQALKQNDIQFLREAAAVLEREGKAYQHDLFTRITAQLDAMDTKKAPSLPPTPEERKALYAQVDKIRNKMPNERDKRALYIMTWEISDNDLENLLLLFREAKTRFIQKTIKTIFDEPRGVKEIQQKLKMLGITEVIPHAGAEFDPTWHLHSDPQKTGFDHRIYKTIHPGYERNNRRLLKAIVEVM